MFYKMIRSQNSCACHAKEVLPPVYGTGFSDRLETTLEPPWCTEYVHVLPKEYECESTYTILALVRSWDAP